MKISTRVEYGLVALTDIAMYCESGESVSAPDIAGRESISHKYLEHILLLLRQAGFVRAQKGIKGGYTLACQPDEITMSDIINALDNNILSGLDESEAEGGLRPVINDLFWEKINVSLNRYAESMTLQDFVVLCRGKISDSWAYVI